MYAYNWLVSVQKFFANLTSAKVRPVPGLLETESAQDQLQAMGEDQRGYPWVSHSIPVSQGYHENGYSMDNLWIIYG